MRTLESQYLWNLESGRKENRRSTVFLGSNCYFFTKNYLKNLHCVQFRICQTLEVSEYLVLSDHSHRKIEWYTLGLTAEVDNSTRRPGVKRAAWRGINQRQVITACWTLLLLCCCCCCQETMPRKNKAMCFGPLRSIIILHLSSELPTIITTES